MNRYDLGLIGPALQYIEDEFNLGSVTKEVVVAATKAGAVPGGKDFVSRCLDPKPWNDST